MKLRDAPVPRNLANHVTPSSKSVRNITRKLCGRGSKALGHLFLVPKRKIRICTALFVYRSVDARR